MRKIINFTHATLDGYIDNLHTWSHHSVTDEVQDHLVEMHLAADALPLGRITYEEMAQSWPNFGGNPFSDHINWRCCVVRSGCAADRRWRRTGQIIEASSSNAAAQRRRLARASTPSS